MADQLAGKVALVTGSTGGIGEAIARLFASEGAAVIVTGRRAEEGEQIAREIRNSGGRAAFHPADVSREHDCLALVQAAIEHFGRLDILVNDAADLAHAKFEELTVDEWDHAFAVNVRAPLLLARAATPHMRAQGGGVIVNIGTGHGYVSTPERVAYGASKGALLNLTKTLAKALLPDRIRVNWITVGWVATPQEIALRNETHGDGGEFLRETGAKRPLGRHETPEDIAAGALYLASDEASHVTGCELNITGGLRI